MRIFSLQRAAPEQLSQPIRAAALYHRGRARAELGQREEALKDLTEAAALEPANRSYRYERGTVAMSLGRRDEAAEDFKAARVDEVLQQIAAQEKEFLRKRGGKV